MGVWGVGRAQAPHTLFWTQPCTSWSPATSSVTGTAWLPPTRATLPQQQGLREGGVPGGAGDRHNRESDSDGSTRPATRRGHGTRPRPHAGWAVTGAESRDSTGSAASPTGNAQKNHLNLSLLNSVVEFPPFYGIICLINSLYHISSPRPLAA